MPYVYNDSHVTQALELTLGQLWESPRLRELIDALVTQIQVVEDVIEELSTERLLANAEGAQLDDYGELVGQQRLGLDDDRFRVLIQTRIQANGSNGEATRLIEVISVVVGADVWYRWRGPACYSLEYETATPLEADFVRFLREVVLLCTPVGVEFEVVEAPVGAFRFDTPGSGFDDGLFARRVL